jgi:hypothetical protein
MSADYGVATMPPALAVQSAAQVNAFCELVASRAAIFVILSQRRARERGAPCFFAYLGAAIGT